jgi:hypothetical protein
MQQVLIIITVTGWYLTNWPMHCDHFLNYCVILNCKSRRMWKETLVAHFDTLQNLTARAHGTTQNIFRFPRRELD